MSWVETMGLQHPFPCEGKGASEKSMEKCNALKDRGGRYFASVQSISSKREEVRNRAQGFQWLLEGNPDALEEARVSS